MYTPKLLAITLAAAILPTAVLAQWPSCDPSCKSCGLYCNTGCVAPLDQAECDRCLYCRRESSSCSWQDISGGWTENPPDPAYCAQCRDGCHCKIDAQCYDNITITPPLSTPPTATPVALYKGRN